jgi:hypothetical protein
VLWRKDSLHGLFIRTVVVCSLAAMAILSTGCGAGRSAAQKSGKMGDRMQVGPLIYTVLDSEWKTSLGESAETKYPKSRFLILRLSVTNSGVSECAIPSLTLEDAAGNRYQEGVDGQAIPEWLAVLRRVKPAETEQGRIYFDVPTGAYKLRVTDDADPEQAKVAWIEIPFHVEQEGAVPMPSLPVPAASKERP